MIHILAHRGAWSAQSQQNSPAALRGALARGWGVELDVRDRAGDLVLSHDPPDRDHWVVLGAIRDVLSGQLPVFVNVKSDGLAALLEPWLSGDEVFVFDMSVPDTQAYLEDGFRVFTRQSDEEPQPPFYSKAVGVWMDQLYVPWIAETDITRHLQAGKRVAVVSDELHGKSHTPLWELLRQISDGHSGDSSRLYLCTDLPHEAEVFFTASARTVASNSR